MANVKNPPGSKPAGPAGVTAQQPAPAPTRVTLSKGGRKVGGGLLAQLKAEKEVATGDKLDERINGLKGFVPVAPPALFKEFVEKMAPRLKLPLTSGSIVRAFANIDVTAEKVAFALNSNAYYGSQFFKMIESMGKREELPSTEGAVILLGMQNSRNLIIALQMLRSVKGGHAEWTKEGKLKFAANDLIKYALKTEEILAGDKSAYADTAYAAGLMFDYMALFAQDSADAKTLSAFIDTIYTHGLTTAKIATELSKHIPQFSFSKYVFSAALIHDIGKVVLALLNGNYPVFLEEVHKRGLPLSVSTFAEEKEFSVQHAWLSALCCRCFPIFKAIEKGVFYHHSPYLLRTVNRNLYQLSSLICLASNMAGDLKKVDRTDDPILAVWKGPELKDFKIDNRTIMAAAAKGL